MSTEAHKTKRQQEHSVHIPHIVCATCYLRSQRVVARFQNCFTVLSTLAVRPPGRVFSRLSTSRLCGHIAYSFVRVEHCFGQAMPRCCAVRGESALHSFGEVWIIRAPWVSRRWVVDNARLAISSRLKLKNLVAFKVPAIGYTQVPGNTVPHERQICVDWLG